MLTRSPLLSSGSGKCGDVVATRTHQGFVLRGWVNPDQPWNQRQIDRYTAFRDINLRWMTLSEAQRASWRQYGAAVELRNSLGQGHFATGRNQYVRTNVYRNMIPGGPEWIDNAPLIWQMAFPLIPSAFTATIDSSGNCTLHLSLSTLQYATAPADGSYFFVSSTGPHTVDKFFCTGPFREVAAIALPVSGPWIEDIAVGPLLGWDTDGDESVFIQIVVSMKDGRTSSAFFNRAITVPE